MYAIFENGSKQYKVSVGDSVKLEKLKAEVGASVQFPVVLTSDDNGIAVGEDVKNLSVTCEVVSHGKDKKIIVFKYKAKKNERKKQGHRQPYTQVKVTAIGAATATEAKPAAKKAAAKPAETAKKPATVKTAETATKAPAAKKPAAKKTETSETAAKPAAKKPAAKKATAEKKED